MNNSNSYRENIKKMDKKVYDLTRFESTYPKLWRKIEGPNRTSYLIPVDVENVGDYVHCDPNNKDSQGYAGREMSFKLEDGSAYKCIGPWHTNTRSVKQATGLDLENKHYHMCAIYTEDKLLYLTELILGMYPNQGIYNYAEKAQAFANNLNKTVSVFVNTNGGSSRYNKLPKESPSAHVDGSS